MKIAFCVRINTKHESINTTADKQKDANIIAEVCSALKGKRPSADKLSLSMDVLNTSVLCLTDLAKCLKPIENCLALVRTSVQSADLKSKCGRSTRGGEGNIVVLEISLGWSESWNACKTAKSTLCKYVGIE